MGKVTTQEFIEKAKKVHGDKYDYSKVEYEHSKKNVIIICREHGEFEIRPNNHLSGQGCPMCGGTKKMTNKEFIEKAMQIHGNKYDYSKVKYVNNKTKVKILCPKHGEFQQLPCHHLKGVGCPKCHFEKLSENFKMSRDAFIERANEIHHNKYLYGEYNGYENNIEIICPIHGAFEQTAHNHLAGNGCKKCAYEKMHNEKTKGFEKFVEEATIKHNGKYTYKEPYVNKDTPIEIICPIHGSFKQIPKVHLRGSGCPKCSSSKLELKIEQLLRNNNIEFIPQCGKTTFNWLTPQHLDFYLPQYNVAIECQGGQHFKSVERFGGEETFEKIIKRDKRKKELCDEHGIKLLYFADKQYQENIIVDENKLLEEIKKV